MLKWIFSVRMTNSSYVIKPLERWRHKYLTLHDFEFVKVLGKKVSTPVVADGYNWDFKHVKNLCGQGKLYDRLNKQQEEDQENISDTFEIILWKGLVLFLQIIGACHLWKDLPVNLWQMMRYWHVFVWCQKFNLELLALSYYTILSQIPLYGVGSYEKREQTNKKLSNAMRPKWDILYVFIKLP